MLPLNFKIFRRFEYGGKYPETKHSMHAQWKATDTAPHSQLCGRHITSTMQWREVESADWSELFGFVKYRSAFSISAQILMALSSLIYRGAWGNISKMNNELILSLQGRMVKSAIHLVCCMWEEEVFRPSTQNVDSCLKKELHCVFLQNLLR